MSETPVFSLPAKGSVLLLMDFQVSIVDMIAKQDPELVPRVAGLAAAARAAGLPVIYAVIGFRPGFVDVSPSNKSFSALKSSGRFAPGSPGVEIHPGLAPQPGDLEVTKRRVSAFAGSGLDLLLRSLGAETLVLAGLSTSGVVLSTLRQAADLDFKLAVVADCCGDTDEEVHRVLTQKVFPRQAEVL
ncbi:MAG TPA: isochorismatase family cysteine hydrolase, partial [bacterium]|nr:isochorismatase family cysteine hydrolase [bacterium]